MDFSTLHATFDKVFNTRLFAIADTPVTLGTLLIFLGIVLATLVTSKLLQRALARGFKARGVQDEGRIGATARLLHYSVLVIGFGIGLQTIGINLSALFAAGAVAAVAIGFAMQTVVQNFVSGLILLVERAIKPGDVLEVDGDMVKVTQMGIRSTVVRTLDDEEMIVPNSNLVQSTVRNSTLHERAVRIRVPIGVAYESDLDQVVDVLREAALTVGEGQVERDPVVLLRSFGDSSVNFEVSIWIRDPWLTAGLKSQLNLAIWRALKRADIVIPFPQVDVHMPGPTSDERAA